MSDGDNKKTQNPFQEEDTPAPEETSLPDLDDLSSMPEDLESPPDPSNKNTPEENTVPSSWSEVEPTSGPADIVPEDMESLTPSSSAEELLAPETPPDTDIHTSEVPDTASLGLKADNPLIPEGAKKKRGGGFFGFLIKLILFLAILGAGAFYALPFVIDWKQQRQEFIDEVKALTGRDLSMSDDIEISVFPKPQFRAYDIRLKNTAGSAAEDMLVIKTLYADISLLLLLQGQVKISHLTAHNVLLNLEDLEETPPNWELRGDQAFAEFVGNFPPYFAVNQLDIDRATVTYSSGTAEAPSQRALRIDRATITAESAHGPFAATGTLSEPGADIGFTMQLGNTAAGTSPLEATLTSGTSQLSFKGDMTRSEEGQNIRGAVNAELSRSIRPLLTFLGINPTTFPYTTFSGLAEETARIKGGLEYTDTSLAISDLIITSNNIEGEGGITWSAEDPSTINAQLSFSKFAIASAADLAPPSPAAENLPKREESAPLDITKNLTLGLDATFASLSLKDHTVRDVRFDGTIGHDTLFIKNLTAKELPGQSAVTVSGNYHAPGTPEQRFESTFQLEGQQLMPLLTWLEVKTPSLKEGVLNTFALDGTIIFEKDKTTLRRLKAQIDDTELVAQAALIKGETSAANSAIRLSRLDLDRYIDLTLLPEDFFSAPADEVTLANDLKQFDQLRQLKDIAEKLGISFRANELTYRGNRYTGVNLVALVTPKLVDIKQLSFEGDDAAMSIKATVNTEELTPQITIAAQAKRLNTAFLFGGEPVSTEPNAIRINPVWSEQDVFLTRLGVANTAFTLKADALTHGHVQMQDATIQGSIDKNTLKIDSFRTKAFDGAADIKAVFGIRSPTISATYSLNNGDLPELLNQLFGNRSLSAGRASLSGRLSTSGTNQRAWVSGLKGDISFTSSGLKLPNIDLKKIAFETDSITERGAVYAFVNDNLINTSEETPLDYSSGKIMIEQGIASFKDITLTHPLLKQGSFKGSFNIPEWQLNINSKLDLYMGTDLDRPSAPLTVAAEGPPHNISYGWNTSGITQYWQRRHGSPTP